MTINTKAIHTDLYQLTMMASYFHQGIIDKPVKCEMFVRRLPKNRRFLLAAGLEQALDYLSDLRFTDAQIEHLRSIPAMKKALTRDFVEYLRRFRFTGTVFGLPEGTVFFQNEPLVRVEAPLGQAQLVETFILSSLNHQTMIASKAARMVLAGQGRPLLDFGSRRTDPIAAVLAARAAYIAGFEGTSNVEASYQYDIPARGTMAHMLVMAAKTEADAFQGYSSTFPNSTYLVDTYDTLNGIRTALQTAGDKVKAIRIDSGDLPTITKDARALLNELGRPDVQIFLSSDLDEYELSKFNDLDVPYDGAGIGTRLVTSDDAPSLGGVYKLVEIEGRSVAKFSKDKVSYPGPKQIYRKKGLDWLGLPNEQGYEFLSAKPMLEVVLSRGTAYRYEDINIMRARAAQGIKELPDRLKVIERTDDYSQSTYEVKPSENLTALLNNAAKEQKQ
jgi:nicotinate phosphoribosyltransferase